eukprot:SM000177S03189  [mRNA]  locus=s177:86940:88084:- [translate_table: standard]
MASSRPAAAAPAAGGLGKRPTGPPLRPPPVKDAKPAAVAAKAVPSGAPKAAAPRDVPKTGNATRDKTRELFAEALLMTLKEASGETLTRASGCSPLGVAAAVEAEMFRLFGGSKDLKEYKAKYRSISYNLKDPKNPDLRRKVLMGEVSPSGLMGLTSEEMASDERQRENRAIKEKALFECERGLKQALS